MAWKTILPGDEIRKIITGYEAKLEDLLDERGWSKDLISELSPLLFFNLLSPYEHLYVAHPGELLRHREDKWLMNLLLPHDLIYIGCCGNGDFVAVKATDASVVLISHEEFDSRDLSNLERITRTIAGSVSEYLLAVHRKKAPLDYWDKRRTQKDGARKSRGGSNREKPGA